MADSFASPFNKAPHPPSNPDQRFGSHAMNPGPGSFMAADKPRDAGPPTANAPMASSAPAPVPVADAPPAPFGSAEKKDSLFEAAKPVESKPVGIPGLSQAPKPAEEPPKASELPKISELPKPIGTTTGSGLPGLSNLSGSSFPKAAEPPKSEALPSIFGEPKQEPPKAPEPEKKDSLPGIFGAPKQELPKVSEPPKSDNLSSLFGAPKASEAPKASDMPGLFGKTKPQEPAKEAEPPKPTAQSLGISSASSTGPAHIPKPVEIISAPETPMNTGTPAGGTPRPELKITDEPVAKSEPEPKVVTGVQEPAPTPQKSVAEAAPKTNILNGSESKSSTNASPFASGALQQDEPRPVPAPVSSEPKVGEKRKFEDDAAPALDTKPVEAEAKKPKVDEPAKSSEGLNGSSNAPAPAAIPAAAPAASAAPAATAAPAAAPATEAPAPKKPGRPKKDKKKPAAPVGRTQRKTRSQGPADAAL